jgi:Right handed beta helix region
MKKVSLIFILTMAIAALANAQATRTWVSGVGDDVNPCSRTAPCKTFAGAISKTASPGIINCLDPGGFGAVTITKSITLDCTGTLGSVLSSGVQGIIINAQTTDKIVLRGLDINGAGTTLGTNGVNILQAASVSVDNCNIANYSGSGIVMSNSTNSIGLFVANSHILNTGTGILLNNSGGIAKVLAENTIIEGNNIGVKMAGVNNGAVLTRCDISRNTTVNFEADPSTAVAFLESCQLATSATGILAGTGVNTPAIRLSRCSVTGNTTNGISGPGSTTCFSNNVIAGNLGNQACSVPNQAQQ